VVMRSPITSRHLRAVLETPQPDLAAGM
jgi:hypothetical protein